jgi:hypothetical protein
VDTLDKGYWQDVVGQLEISSHYSKWSAIENLEIVCFQNLSLNVFRPWLTVGNDE